METATSGPSIIPANNFDAKKDAEKLFKAMKGFLCDKEAITSILSQRSNKQCVEIAITYNATYKKELANAFEKALRGDFEKLAVALVMPRGGFLAKAVHNALKDESALIEIMVPLSNSDMRDLVASYKQKYNNELYDDLTSLNNDSCIDFLKQLTLTHRDETQSVNEPKSKEEAHILYKAGNKDCTEYDGEFLKTFTNRSFSHLKEVFKQYEKQTGHTVSEAIEIGMAGFMKEALLTMLDCVENPANYFAKRLYKSMEGFGTEDETLIRLVVSRCEIDMKDIVTAFAGEYTKSLESYVASETSGDYKKLLLALIKGK